MEEVEAEPLKVNQWLEIPEEVFLQTFSYVEVTSRRNVALACKKFYSLMCESEKDEFPLDLSYKQVCLISSNTEQDT